MKDMSSFSFHRFTLLLRHELVSGWRRHVRELLVFYVVFLACIGSVFYAPSRYGLGYEGVEHWTFPSASVMFGSAVQAVSIAFYVMLVYGVSLTFSNLYNKQQRIAWLMLPATNLEKFLVRVFVYDVLWGVALFVALVLADATRMLVFPILGHGYPSMLPDLVRTWSMYVEHLFLPGGASLTVYAGGLLQFFLSFVILFSGSALFRRYALVKTVFGVFLASLLILLIVDMSGLAYFLLVDNPMVLVWQVALIAGGLWLSWRLMSRMQVISRRNAFLSLRKRKEV